MKYETLSQDTIDIAIQSGGGPPRHRPGEKFLRGPIPLDWLLRASGLPGKAITVAIAIWFRAGLTKSGRVRVSRALLKPFGVGRSAGYSGLRAMESAQLLSVERRDGRAPVVTILSVDSAGDMVSTDDIEAYDVGSKAAANVQSPTRCDPE